MAIAARMLVLLGEQDGDLTSWLTAADVALPRSRPTGPRTAFLTVCLDAVRRSSRASFWRSQDLGYCVRRLPKA